MSDYYNDIDKHACGWAKQLIKTGLAPEGFVDERSILDVRADELAGYRRLHFFAGILGWPYALELAGWPQDWPVVTASLPCQPFSSAGKQLGVDDERHLLPHFIELVKRSDWPVVFGEQVASAIGHGWLDDLYAEMEREGYAVGSAVLTAAGSGAPHIRQRLYWVAYRNGIGFDSRGKTAGQKAWIGPRIDSGRPINRLVDSESDGFEPGGYGDDRAIQREDGAENVGFGQLDGGVEYAESEQMGISGQSRQRRNADHWRDIEWLPCRDEKLRPIKPGLKPLVNGISGRVGHGGDSSIQANETSEARQMRLKGYGNAIVPQVAADFIRAFLSVI